MKGGEIDNEQVWLCTFLAASFSLSFSLLGSLFFSLGLMAELIRERPQKRPSFVRVCSSSAGAQFLAPGWRLRPRYQNDPRCLPVSSLAPAVVGRHA